MTAFATLPTPVLNPSRWRRARIGALAVVAVMFLVYAVPPYLTLDPARSRIQAPAGHPFYYRLLAAHVIFGAIAMMTCLLQLWPSFRRRHPEAHRLIGRLYVFGGVVPASLLGFSIGTISPFGPVIRASNMLLAVLWLSCTIAGFRMGRQGRFVEHRRWMLRSATLTLSIITNRVWAVVAALLLIPQLSTMFDGNERLMVQAIAGMAGWLGWTLPLLVTELVLDREATRSARQARPDHVPVARPDPLPS